MIRRSGIYRATRNCGAIGLLLWLPYAVCAHPVPRDAHDRTIQVDLTRLLGPATVGVEIRYRLEVDEYTVNTRDMYHHLDRIDLSKYTDIRSGFYREYLRIFAPIIARNLECSIDGKPLALQSIAARYTLTSDDGRPLGHVRFDFSYRATVDLNPATEHVLRFREGNWELDTGKIDLTFGPAPADGAGRVIAAIGHTCRGGLPAGVIGALLLEPYALRIDAVLAPTPELRRRKLVSLRPEEEEAVRCLQVRFALAAADPRPTPPGFAAAADGNDPPAPAAIAPVAMVDAPPATEQSNDVVGSDHSLVQLLSEYRHALWLLLALSFFFGAAHALTPGHGKTLMAAYLVGEHGTALHAVILGLVTTFTHTAIVIAFAVGLLFVPERFLLSIVQWLQIGFGILIAGIGFYLLTRRLSGKVDHIHIGGGHHHHHDHHGHHGPHGHHHHAHHHDHDHSHDSPGHEHSHGDHAQLHSHGHEGEHSHVHPHEHSHDEALVKGKVSWWQLIVMGMQGGLVPCWDAVALLCYAVASGMLAYALPMVLSFSAGLAFVLVVIGIIVVTSKRLAEANWGDHPVIRALPIVSAGLVMAIGIFLFYEGLHGMH